MYNYYQNPPYVPQNRPYENPFIQKQEVIKVNGKNGAEALNLPPNSSALLLDEHDPIVWLKVTDGAGYPSITAYSITPYKEKPQIDVNRLEERIARLEERLNGKSNSNNAEQKRNDGAK